MSTITWFPLALAGYFFYAVVTVVNKYLLGQRAITQPVVFTFWLCLLSVFSFVLVPFGLVWPGWPWFLLDLLAGAVFFVSLLTFYRALDVNEASRAAAFIGGLTPVFVLALAFLFLREDLSRWQILAFGFLVAGGLLISFKKGRLGFREE